MALDKFSGVEGAQFFISMALDKASVEKTRKDTENAIKQLYKVYWASQKPVAGSQGVYGGAAQMQLNKQFKELAGGGLKFLGIEKLRTYTKTINHVKKTLTDVSASFLDANNRIRTFTWTVSKAGRKQEVLAGSFRSTNQEAKKLDRGLGSLITNSAKLAARAVAVIPIWMALRALWMSVANTVTDLVSTYMKFDEQMARVATVTRGTESDLKSLRSTVLTVGADSSRGLDEIAKAMYALGSAGLTVSQQMAGVQHIMNLTIGTFGNTEQAAKLVAGIFNVFGDSLEGVYTNYQKFKYISDTLAYVYSSQQVELSELSNALTYVASVGDLLNVKFQTLVATIGFLNTGLLKGTKSGTSLLNAFAQLAKNADKLGVLGVVFDPSKPLDFENVMNQLIDTYKDTGISINDLKDLMDVFGLRGGRAVAQIISSFERWRKTIADTKANFKDFAEYMEQQATKSLPMAWAKLGNAIKSALYEAVNTEGIRKRIDDWAEMLSNFAKTRVLEREYSALLPKKLVQKKPTAWDMRLLAVSGATPGASSITNNIVDQIKSYQAEMATWAKQNATLMEAYKAVQVGGAGKPTENVSRLDRLLKSLAESTITEKEARLLITRLLEKNSSFASLELKQQRAIVTYLVEQVKQQRKKVEASNEYRKAQKEELKHLEESFKYARMTAQGYDDQDVILAKISDKVAELNEKVKAQKDIKLETLTVDELLMGNYENLDQIAIHINDSYKRTIELKKLLNEYTVKELEDIQKYADIVENSLSKSLADAMLDKNKGLDNVFSDVATRVRKMFTETFAKSLSESFMNFTGMDKILGYITDKLGKTKLKNQPYIDGGKILYNSIVKACQEGSRFFGGSLGIGSGGMGAPGTILTGQSPAINPYSPLFASSGGWYNGGGNLPGKKVGHFSKGVQRVHQFGQLLGVAASSAMAGQAGYDSAGMFGAISGGLGSMILGLEGLGFAGAATDAGMFGMGALMPGIGIALMAASLIASLTASPPSWTRTESRETLKSIGSKIDISNSQLEWVNRNLVALRQELTYILPESYYFRERAESERFALDAQRGVL